MQAGGGFNPYQQNPEMAQLAAILGMNSGNNNNNNNINAYLPYMTAGGSVNPEIQKQMIQNMMMSQMMPGFGTGGF